MSAEGLQATRIGLFWRNVSRSPIPEASWPSAIRRGLMPAALMTIGALFGHFPEAAVASIGALNLGLVDGAVPKRTLAIALSATAAISTVLAFFGALSAHHWWSVLLLAAMAFVSGVISGSGLIGFNVGFTGLVTVIVFSGTAASLAGALQSAGLVLLGCIAQGISSFVAYRFEHDVSIRHAVDTAIRELRHFALAKHGLETANFNAAAVELEAREALNSSRLTKDRHEAFAVLLDDLTWVRLQIAQWRDAGEPSAEEFAAVAWAFDRIDSSVKHSVREHHQAPATPAVSGPFADLMEQLAKVEASADRLKATPPRTGHLDRESDYSVWARADTQVSSAERNARIKKLFTPANGLFHHGLRLAIGIGIAQVVALLISIPHAYWVPLTVCMVLKADFSTTITRGFLRIVGTIAGIVIVGLVLQATGSPVPLSIAIAAVTAPLMMRWITGNYALAAFATTATVLIQIEGLDPSFGTIWARLENTLIGALIAMIVFLAWPAWRGDQLPGLLTKCLNTHKAWADAVLKAYRVPADYSPEEVRSLGREALDSAHTTRPAVDGSILEPHHSDSDPRAARQMLNFCQHAGTALLALEAGLHERGKTAKPLDVSDYQRRVDEDFADAVAAISAPAGTAAPADDGEVPDRLAPTGDVVTDRALGQLVGSADAAVTSARLI